MSYRFRTRRVRVAAALGLGVLTLWVAGCGEDTNSADLEAGKTAFMSCAGCHTLADAGSTGSTGSNPSAGPDLDDAFRAARQAGMHEDQIAGVVHRWIKIAQLPMPRNIVEGQDAINVAAYVASVAGLSEDSEVYPAAPEPPEAPVPPRQELD